MGQFFSCSRLSKVSFWKINEYWWKQLTSQAKLSLLPNLYAPRPHKQTKNQAKKKKPTANKNQTTRHKPRRGLNTLYSPAKLKKKMRFARIILETQSVHRSKQTKQARPESVHENLWSGGYYKSTYGLRTHTGEDKKVRNRLAVVVGITGTQTFFFF